MLRTLPPTAAPLLFRNLFRATVSTLSEDGAENKFKDQIRRYFNIENVFLVSSGKAAIYLALLTLQRMSKRTEVIIPAYSSFCLASVMARSGLSINLCDIDPDTLDFDLSKLQSLITEKTLAVIPVHNYGLVCNLKEIKKLAIGKGAFVVEDAAQAAGALFGDRKVGTIGDVGILSLGRGKNICALGGGVILTDKGPVGEWIAEALGKYPKESLFSDVASIVTGTALSLLLNPERYVLPANLPFLNLGANIFDPDFKMTRFPNFNAEVGQQTFLSMDRFNEIRIQNARLLNKNLHGNGQLKIPEPTPEGGSVYLRFPILFRNKNTRENAFLQLHKKRLGASHSYPAPLSQIAGFKKYMVEDGNFPGAQFVSDRLLTLPTHPYIREDDIQKITSTLHSVTI